MEEWTKRFLVLTINAGLWIRALTVLTLWFARDPENSDFPLLLFVTGALGAVLGTYRKLAEIPADRTEVDNTLRRTAILQIFVSPFIGGVFALLLWMIFYAQMLEGVMFPAICGTDQEYHDWFHLMKDSGPCQFVDAAKGTIWAFVAGYSERFVPSVIDRIAREEDEKHGGNQTRR